MTHLFVPARFSFLGFSLRSVPTVPAEGPSIGVADAFDPLPLALIRLQPFSTRNHEPETRDQRPITIYMFSKRKTEETHESMGVPHVLPVPMFPPEPGSPLNRVPSQGVQPGPHFPPPTGSYGILSGSEFIRG